MRWILALLFVSLCFQEVAVGTKTKEFRRVSRLVGYMASQGYDRSYQDVLSIYKVARYQGRTCLPGMLTKADFLALAYVESRFNPKAVGIYGEKGTWQILRWKERLKKVGGKDPFDVRTNGKMACQVLKEKHRHRRGHFPKMIQSYNGYRSTMKTLPYYDRVTMIKGHLVELI